MQHFRSFITLLSLITLLLMSVACGNNNISENKMALANDTSNSKESNFDTALTALGPIYLPKPYATRSRIKLSRVHDWPEDKLPTVPEGFTVNRFADDLKHPRWVYVAPNGDIFIAESNTRFSANRISLLRDIDKDGVADENMVFIEDLNQPFGMLVINNSFYIANTDGLYKYPYKEGDTKLDPEKGEKIMDLPAGGYNNHWTRNIISNTAKDKLYISVGSASNVAEHGMEEEIRRANILETDLNGKNEIVFASGLRNPVGMDWNPVNGTLWTAVNERDKLGDNLVPDYITSVQKNAFYGWPYSYYGNHLDPRMEGAGTELASKAVVPSVSMGAHTASLGLCFYNNTAFPKKYQNGAFVGQHGSWNRSNLAGYRVAFVPFENGKPSGQPEDFLSGFVKEEDGSVVYGRPVCTAVLPNGDLLVSDDDGDVLWRVSYTGSK